MASKSDAAKAPEPVASPVRKVRGGARSPSDPMKAFRRGVAAPTVLVYIGICVMVLLTLQLMTGEINRIDSDRGRKAISAAINSFVGQVAEQAADEATWTEAYLNTYVEFNPAWLDSTWGATARNDGHYDTAVVTDPKGRILFGESTRGPLNGEVGVFYSATPELYAALDKAIAEFGDDSVVARFTRSSEGGISAIAAAVIHGATGQMSVPAENRRVLWLASSIDDDMLSDIAHRFQIPLPRLDTLEPAHDGEDTLALLDASDAPVGSLVWQPLRPGDAAFMHITSIASVVLFVVGVLIYIVLTAFRRSIERRAEAEERDWVSARYDGATGLLNRFGLEESIARMVPRKGQFPVAIAFIEIEGLKEVVGSYGKENAEALLNKLADLIDSGTAGEAVLARMSSDEFAVCRTGDGAIGLIRKFARTVLDIVAEAIPLDDLRLKLGASIGIAEAMVTRKTISEPIDLAAAAMQRARETGGNHIVEHDTSLEVSRQNRLAIQADIRRGLDANEFDLVYQPIFDFNSQSMLGVEALLRWPRRTGGPMPPGEFIPAAESSGLIEELGLFVLRKACEDLKALEPLKVSVNVSTVQFRSPALSTRIDTILADTAFPPNRLQLEITESFLLAHPERAKTAIEGLRTRGITIALDDFGTGFSSVGYLRQFSFDRVKLDRSLIDEIDLDPVKMALVESTMVFAFAMGLAVTAEGVERREEATVLTRLGCREFQGYLFSRPLNLDGVKRLLEQSQMQKAG